MELEIKDMDFGGIISAVENGVTLFSNLDTVRIVLDVLEEITNKVSTIDAK